MVEHEGISKPLLSPARLAANRRNAKKSTGPKTKAGKRRVALNARRLAPPEMERQLEALGEDPHDFRRLHRDVAALFQPQDVPDEAAVQLLAVTRSLRSGQALVGESATYPRLRHRQCGPHRRSGRKDRGVAERLWCMSNDNCTSRGRRG